MSGYRQGDRGIPYLEWLAEERARLFNERRPANLERVVLRPQTPAEYEAFQARVEALTSRPMEDRRTPVAEWRGHNQGSKKGRRKA